MVRDQRTGPMPTLTPQMSQPHGTVDHGTVLARVCAVHTAVALTGSCPLLLCAQDTARA
eukprot:SAG25_NODE_4369_length_829_cov_1.960274_2_plen_59_part_00